MLEWFRSIPSGIILFFLSQTIIAIGWAIKLHFDVKDLKRKVIELDEDKKALLKEMAEMNRGLSEMNKELAVIRSHAELGTLTKLKTYGSRRGQ